LAVTGVRYCILRFSPRPEDVEFMNVAVLFSDDKVGPIYGASFSKLACVHAGFSAKHLGQYVDFVASELRQHENFEAGLKAVVQSSAQLCHTRVRTLHCEPTKDALALLKKMYLDHAPRTRTRQTFHRHRVEKALDSILRPILPQTFRAAPARTRDFLNHRVQAKLPHDFTVPRVISLESVLVLLDGVHLESALQSIQHRTFQIMANYKAMGEVRRMIEDIEQRTVHLGTVVAGNIENDGRAEPTDAIALLRDYSDSISVNDEPAKELEVAMSKALPALV
jgi:hypothetical protein